MAKGKRRKTGGKNFKKGKSGNPSGRPALPAEVREMRKMSTEEFIRRIDRIFYMSVQQCEKEFKRKDIDVMDKILLSIMISAFQNGDMGRLDKIMDRIVGKVLQPVDVSVSGHMQVLQHIQKLVNGEKPKKGEGKKK